MGKMIKQYKDSAVEGTLVIDLEKIPEELRQRFMSPTQSPLLTISIPKILLTNGVTVNVDHERNATIEIDIMALDIEVSEAK